MITDIRVSDHSIRSCFDLCIDSFLHHFFKIDGFLVLLFHLNLNWKLETLSKIAEHNKLIGNFDRIEFCQDELKILGVGYPVLGVFSLILGVPLKLTLDTINKGLETFKIFLKKGFKLWSYDKSGVFVTALILSLFKANRTVKKWDYK